MANKEYDDVTFEEVDLKSLFAQRTPPPPEPPVNESPEIDPETNQDDFSGDFDPDFDPDLPESPIEEAAEKIGVSYDATKLAESIVDAAEVFLEMGGPIGFQWSLNKDDRQALAVLSRKIRLSGPKNMLTLDEIDQRAMSIYMDLEDFEKDLPFSAKEKKSLVEPLAVLLKESNAETSPSWAFVIAVALVMGPRILPIVRNFFRK